MNRTRRKLGLAWPTGCMRGCAGLVLLALIASACGSGAGAGTAPMQLSVVEGIATLLHKGQSTHLLKGTHPLATGDRVSVSSKGVARIALASGRAFELSGSTSVIVASQSALELRTGDVLATVTAPARVTVEGVDVEGARSTFRVSRDSSSRVRSYDGSSIDVSTAGGTLSLPRFREAVIAGGVLPRSPRPLRLSASDRWDRRLLQDAIDLDERLSNFARGLEAQLGDQPGVQFFQQVTPVGSDVAFIGQFLVNRKSDLLIGLLMTIGASGGQSTGLQQRFATIFSLWSDGASWGLLAHEFGVAQPSLFDGLLSAIQKAGIKIVGGAAGGFVRPRRANPSKSPSSRKRSPTPGSSIGQTTSPSPSPSHALPGGVGDSAPTPVNDIVDQLYGAVPTPH
ncbi:MAG: hypothetical protein ABR507_12215 [Actinomycetota bacterium]|nr:hypothetical protein [Actinomycetota bacterium]